MTRHAPHPSRSTSDRRPRWAALALAAAALLSACGGGGDEDGTPPLSCSVADQKTWLRSYMNDWYFWYASSPNPAPTASGTVDDYFQALLYTGTDTAFPAADRWSYVSSTEDYSRFFEDGQTLGFGLMVAGLEVSGQPDQPLWVRYVEPGSPADRAGLRRGDQVLALNGRSTAELIAADDFSALTPAVTGQSLTVSWRREGTDRSATLSAAVYTLAPVPQATVVTTPAGRKLGYLVVKDMITQARTPLDVAFQQFRAAGVQDVVIDLRYNGGGLVSVGADLASYPAGTRTAGQTYARLLYNDRHASSNETFRFTGFSAALSLNRVFVLTGPRTCSASEQVVNGLRPFVNVYTVGDTTCGKPVGFLPQDDGCGNTFSAVNFESVNASQEGRYFDGFLPSCAVAEDFRQPMGSLSEPLLAVAADLADGGACATATSATGRRQAQGLRAGSVVRRAWVEDSGESAARRGMKAK